MAGKRYRHKHSWSNLVSSTTISSMFEYPWIFPDVNNDDHIGHSTYLAVQQSSSQAV